MERRNFVKSTLVAGAALAVGGVGTVAAAQSDGSSPSMKPFTLKYAPSPGQFGAVAGADIIDELKYMADQGFRAMEDNGMMGRSPEQQEAIGKEMERLGMTMGVFVSYAEFGAPTLVRRNPEVRDILKDRLTQAIEVAKRVNAKWTTVVPGGYDLSQEYDYQLANCIDNLKYACEICEPAGLVMVLEPLNPWTNHGGVFLTRIPQAYHICRAVGSPSCKILNDLYHQQITEGNLIPNIDKAWDEIAYYQTGDNPGRNEPTTGEINYANVFAHLHRRGFDGVIGMEHGHSKGGAEGVLACIEAYRSVDPEA